MTRRIDTTRRLDKCRSILEHDHDDFRRLVASQLPSEDAASDERKAKLRECWNAMYSALAKIEEEDDTGKYRELSNCVKGLLSAAHVNFDPIPQNASDMSKKAIKDFIRRQIAKWFSDKIASLGEDCGCWSVEQKQVILAALRDSIDIDNDGEGSLFHLIKYNLGNISDPTTTDAARFPFALMFGNILLNGSGRRESGETAPGERNPRILEQFIQAQFDKDSAREGSPYFHRILKPFLERLEHLADNPKAGARPPQEGDAELKEIFDRLEASQTFQIR